jgi:hypothetical protein
MLKRKIYQGVRINYALVQSHLSKLMPELDIPSTFLILGGYRSSGCSTKSDVVDLGELMHPQL